MKRSGLFTTDGKLFRALSKFADLVTLNLLWIVCCLPIVTIGASTTALYYVLLKMVKGEESYIAKDFFHSFLENFKQATRIWVIFCGIGSILYFDFYFSAHAGGEGTRLLFLPFALITALLIMTVCYVFPVLSFFKNSTKKTLKNSFFMALAHLPYTILIVIVTCMPVFILFFLPGGIVLGTFIDVVIGVAGFGWVNAYIFQKLFQRYIPRKISHFSVQDI